MRGAADFFLDPTAEQPYYAALYVCQLGERSLRGGDAKPRLLERRLMGLRWDSTGEFTGCAPNHLIALVGAPPSLAWKAGTLLQSPMDQVHRADAYARMQAENHVFAAGPGGGARRVVGAVGRFAARV